MFFGIFSSQSAPQRPGGLRYAQYSFLVYNTRQWWSEEFWLDADSKFHSFWLQPSSSDVLSHPDSLSLSIRIGEKWLSVQEWVGTRIVWQIWCQNGSRDQKIHGTNGKEIIHCKIKWEKQSNAGNPPQLWIRRDARNAVDRYTASERRPTLPTIHHGTRHQFLAGGHWASHLFWRNDELPKNRPRKRKARFDHHRARPTLRLNLLINKITSKDVYQRKSQIMAWEAHIA